MKWKYKILGRFTHVHVYCKGMLCGMLIFRNEDFERIKSQSKEIGFEKEPELTVRDGLLYCEGKMIDVPEADAIARERGFQFAEQLVRHLESK